MYMALVVNLSQWEEDVFLMQDCREIGECISDLPSGENKRHDTDDPIRHRGPPQETFPEYTREEIRYSQASRPFEIAGCGEGAGTMPILEQMLSGAKGHLNKGTIREAQSFMSKSEKHDPTPASTSSPVHDWKVHVEEIITWKQDENLLIVAYNWITEQFHRPKNDLGKACMSGSSPDVVGARERRILNSRHLSEPIRMRRRKGTKEHPSSTTSMGCPGTLVQPATLLRCRLHKNGPAFPKLIAIVNDNAGRVTIQKVIRVHHRLRSGGRLCCTSGLLQVTKNKLGNNVDRNNGLNLRSSGNLRGWNQLGFRAKLA
ncbi:hypothetical protein B0H34DRAFT_675056 [Crassisporium funariophilum]|nr:hypothetical protein B0H34DRAFT_675056 [Crassisporium funariophilum]